MYLRCISPVRKELAELAYRGLLKHLASHNVHVPASFHETVFESATPRIDAVPIINHIGFANISETSRVALWMDVAMSVHNRWIQLTANDFANSPTRYKWMPFELIGLHAIREFGDDINRLMELLYLAPRFQSVAITYANMQDSFMEAHCITDVDSLIGFVTRYGARATINGEQQQLIGISGEPARGVVEQLLEQGIIFQH